MSECILFVLSNALLENRLIVKSIMSAFLSLNAACFISSGVIPER